MNAQKKTMLIGAAIGAVVGAMAALMYFNSHAEVVEEGGEVKLDPPTAGTAIKMGVTLLGFMRQMGE